MIIDHLFTRTLFESQTDHITQFASNAHEEWRRNFDPTGTKPRIKKNSDGTEGDINVPFADLHPDWQKENLAAAHAAHRAVKHFGRDMEKAAEYVHNEWMKRNPKADYNAAQHVPYDDLPEDEKEKDRVHVRTMMQLMGHSPEQGVAEGNEWQGNRGNSQAGITDHTFDEAKQYIKGNYPFHRTYNVSRVEPGMRYHANPEKVANKTQSLVKGIDSALDYLQVKQNPMMSGSTQVTPSIGYSWHTHESRANGIAVLYYEDRGMGNDTITIAAKDRNNLKGAVQVCRDAGVIPPPKVKKQGMAEGSDRVDSLVTDALKIMRGPEMSDAVLALKRVLGDRAYNERRGFYSFYVDKIHHMYGQQGMAEAKNLKKHVKIVKGPDAGKSGWIREIKHGLFKGAPKTYYIDLDGGGQANNLSATALRLVKDQGVAESNTLMIKLKQALLKEGRVKELALDLKTLNDAEFMKKYGKVKATIRADMKKVDEGKIEKTKTGIIHRGDSYGGGEELPNGGGNRSGFPNPGKYAKDLDHLDKNLTSKLDKSMGITWPRGRQKQDLDEGNMPQSVIKSKQKYADMSDQEFHAAHKNKSEDDLKSMAWRHGYGKGSNHYVNRHKKGGGQLNELSNVKLGLYKTAAGKDATAADKAGNFKRGNKRMSGITNATKKELDNDAAKAAADAAAKTKKIDESRQARQALMAKIVNHR